MVRFIFFVADVGQSAGDSFALDQYQEWFVVCFHAWKECVGMCCVVYVRITVIVRFNEKKLSGDEQNMLRFYQEEAVNVMERVFCYVSNVVRYFYGIRCH